MWIYRRLSTVFFLKNIFTGGSCNYRTFPYVNIVYIRVSFSNDIKKNKKNINSNTNRYYHSSSISTKIDNRKSIKSFILNFGPQHPAAHGIIKLICSFSGEVIDFIEIAFGLLHRGTEKGFESRGLLLSIPYMDRLDYVANLLQETSVVLAIEGSVGRICPNNIYTFRIILNELSRILNHLLTVSAICLDMGAMGPIFWAFEEREFIMELFERVSGARMHTAMLVPYGVVFNFLRDKFLRDLSFLVSHGSRFICGSFLSLLNNRSLKSRLVGVGFFSKSKILKYGVSGIIGRSCGLKYDLRLTCNNNESLNLTSLFSFKSFISLRGDNFDRFLLRSKEILASFSIINQCLTFLDISDMRKKTKYKTMESVIGKFKNFSSMGQSSSAGGYFFGNVEGPKGVVSSFLVMNDSCVVSRFQLRSPVAFNLHLLSTLGNGSTFGDFVASFCSLDVVFGEIDR